MSAGARSVRSPCSPVRPWAARTASGSSAPGCGGRRPGRAGWLRSRTGESRTRPVTGRAARSGRRRAGPWWRRWTSRAGRRARRRSARRSGWRRRGRATRCRRGGRGRPGGGGRRGRPGRRGRGPGSCWRCRNGMTFMGCSRVAPRPCTVMTQVSRAPGTNQAGSGAEFAGDRRRRCGRGRARCPGRRCARCGVSHTLSPGSRRAVGDAFQAAYDGVGGVRGVVEDGADDGVAAARRSRP